MLVQRTQPEPTVALVTVDGEVDVDRASEITAMVAAAVADWAPRRVVVDLAAVPLIDSTGIGELIKSNRIASAANATFAVVNPSPFVLGALGVTGLLQVFGLAEASARDALDDGGG
jgi:anti-anti-sigma factor